MRIRDYKFSGERGMIILANGDVWFKKFDSTRTALAENYAIALFEGNISISFLRSHGYKRVYQVQQGSMSVEGVVVTETVGDYLLHTLGEASPRPIAYKKPKKKSV